MAQGTSPCGRSVAIYTTESALRDRDADFRAACLPAMRHRLSARHGEAHVCRGHWERNKRELTGAAVQNGRSSGARCFSYCRKLPLLKGKWSMCSQMDGRNDQRWPAGCRATLGKSDNTHTVRTTVNTWQQLVGSALTRSGPEVGTGQCPSTS